MPQRKPYKHEGGRLGDRVFQATGMSLSALVKLAVVLVACAAGIGFTVFYKDFARLGGNGLTGSAEGSSQGRVLDELKFVELSEIPAGFTEKIPVEQIAIVNSRISLGEELVRSGGQYSERATGILVKLYGELCRLQESTGINSERSYQKLAEFRKQAKLAGNEERVAEADFLRAFAATSRLTNHDEKVDFRFAADAVINLESKTLVNPTLLSRLYDAAIDLYESSPQQGDTAIYLSLLGDKLIASPIDSISNMGFNLKDYPQYGRLYRAIDKQAFTTRESKFELFRDLFETIEETPPQSLKTYKTTIRFFDELLNQSDVKYASYLTKRLGKAASLVSPKIKAYADSAIANINKRASIIGTTITLTGITADGEQLDLPSSQPTVLVIWDPRSEASAQYVKKLADSGRFDPWATNVLVASSMELSDDQHRAFSKRVPKYSVLDNAPARRLIQGLGVDRVPYMVTIDKDGKVIRFSSN